MTGDVAGTERGSCMIPTLGKNTPTDPARCALDPGYRRLQRNKCQWIELSCWLLLDTVNHFLTAFPWLVSKTIVSKSWLCPTSSLAEHDMDRSYTPSPPNSPSLHNDSCNIAPLTPSQSPVSWRNNFTAHLYTRIHIILTLTCRDPALCWCVPHLNVLCLLLGCDLEGCVLAFILCCAKMCKYLEKITNPSKNKILVQSTGENSPHRDSFKIPSVWKCLNSLKDEHSKTDLHHHLFTNEGLLKMYGSHTIEKSYIAWGNIGHPKVKFLALLGRTHH